MFKKFKRLLSTAMAAVMTVSCFMVVNTQSVLADDTPYAAWDFKGGYGRSTESGAVIFSSETFSNENVSPNGGSADKEITVTGQIACNGANNGVQFKDGATISVPVNAGSVLNVYGYPGHSHYTVAGNEPNQGNGYDYVYNAVSAGTVEIASTSSGGNGYLYAIKCTYPETAPAVTDVEVNFTDSTKFSGMTSPTYVDSSGNVITQENPTDYAVKVENASYNGGTYGIQGSGSGKSAVKLTFKDVVGPAEIHIGTADYYGVWQPTAESGQFADADGVIGTSFSGEGGKWASNHSNYNTVYFNGTGTQDIVLTSVGSKNGMAYLPYISIETVSSVPEFVTYTTKNVAVSLTGVDETDTAKHFVILTNTEDDKDVVVAQAGGDTVKLRVGSTYTAQVAGGYFAYTLNSNSLAVGDTTTSASFAVTKVTGTPESGTSYTYNFANGSVMPANASIIYDGFTTPDGLATVSGSFIWHDNQHGLQTKANTAFSIKVAGDSTITFVGCAYSPSSSAISTTNSSITPSSQTTAGDGSTDAVLYSFTYTGAAATLEFTATSGQYIHAVQIAPYNSFDDTIYVGATRPYTTVESAIAAVNTMGETDKTITVNIDAGTYDIGDTPVAVTRPNVSFVGAGSGSTVITSDNKGGSGKPVDTSGASTHHAGTIIVRADNVSFKDLKIANTVTSENSSALEIYAANSSFTDCIIYAYCDTIRTGDGSANAYTSGSFKNCTIAGWQDVVYGGGQYTFDGCTFLSNTTQGDTRFFAPGGKYTKYKFIINNAIIDAEQSSSMHIYFARPWDISGNNKAGIDGINGELVINGYTVTENATAAFNNAVSAQNLYGFDRLGPNSSETESKSTEAFFFVKADADSAYYNTPNTVLNTACALNTTETKQVGEDMKFVGNINEDLVSNNNVSEVGFLVNGDKLLSFDEVLRYEGKYYIVFFVNGLTMTDAKNKTMKDVNSYTKYGNYSIKGAVSEYGE